jgi:hypothetical protein
MKALATLSLLTFILSPLFAQYNVGFQLVDLHIHLKGGLTMEKALERSEKDNVQYGVAVNCGLGFPVQNDAQVDSFLQAMKPYPQIYKGMQAEGREWVDMFSREAIDKFDYVFTDAMTLTDEKGRRNRIWIEEETWIDDEQDFMDYLVQTTVNIIKNEPIDIYVNPTFLPEQMADRYDKFWTKDRMERVIDAAIASNVAIEINNRFKIPSQDFICLAKEKGAKFTVGTNNAGIDYPGPDYAVEMIKACGLDENDFFVPGQ